MEYEIKVYVLQPRLSSLNGQIVKAKTNRIRSFWRYTTFCRELKKLVFHPYAFHSTCLLFVLTFDFNIFNNPFNKHQKSNQKINFTFFFLMLRDVKDWRRQRAAVRSHSFLLLQVFIRLSMKLKYQKKKYNLPECLCNWSNGQGKEGFFMSFHIDSVRTFIRRVTQSRENFCFISPLLRPPSSNSASKPESY